MRTAKAREYLDKLLQGEEFTEAELLDLITIEGEGLYVEFKDGKETEQKEKCARTIRQNVSGFANSDGGVLLIGVSDAKPRAITKTIRPGGQSLNEWATNVLADLSPWLAPPPRMHVVN